MANTQPNNAPYFPQNNYIAVQGVSTSPFTDERAVGTGGGPQPGAGGNMIFTPGIGPTSGKISCDDGNADEDIIQIDQGADPLAIGNNNGNITLDTNAVNLASNANINVIAQGGVVVGATAGNIVASAGAQVQLNGPTGLDFEANSGDVEITTTAGEMRLEAPQGVLRGDGLSITLDAQNIARIESGTGTFIESGGDITLDTEDSNISMLVNNTGGGVNSGRIRVEDSSVGVVAAQGEFRSDGVIELAALDPGGSGESRLDLDGSAGASQLFATDEITIFSIPNTSTVADAAIVMNRTTGPDSSNIFARVQADVATPSNNEIASILMESQADIGGGNQASEIRVRAGQVDIFSDIQTTSGIQIGNNNAAGSLVHSMQMGLATQPNNLNSVSFVETQLFLLAAPTTAPSNNLPVYAFAEGQGFWQFTNQPTLNAVLTCTNSVANGGSINTPAVLQWVAPSGGNLNTLDITYDTQSSVLTLSDPVDGDISSTAIVSGRTVLLEDVTVNLTNEISCIGLSNSVFPPPASTSLVGNNPPRVEIPTSGVSPWFPGASFRATIAGTIDDFDNNDNLVCTVYSNRGQTSETILNEFNTELESVGTGVTLGWKWEVLFTCRSANTPGSPPVLGVIASNSKFDYTDDQSTPQPEGFVVSNANASFDSSIDQYIDFTLQFQQGGNELTTNLFIIERIY